MNRYGEPAGHGTDARYRRHLRNGDTPCGACKDAHARTVARHRSARGRPSRAKAAGQSGRSQG